MLLKKVMTLITVGICLAFVVSNIELSNIEVNEERLIALNESNGTIANVTAMELENSNCKEKAWLEQFKTSHTEKQFRDLLDILNMSVEDYELTC